MFLRLAEKSVSRLFAPRLEFLLLELLLRNLLLLRLRRRLGDRLLLLSENDLNVAWTAHVCVDSSVSAVGASTHLGRTVYLDVFYDKVIRVQALELCIALCIFKHLKQELGALLGPATLGRAPVLRLRAAAHAAGEAPEGHALLVRYDVLEEGDRAA